MTVLTVGTKGKFDYGSLASAVAASKDGDVIQVQAGTYTNDFATIITNITIEGVGGMVNLVATKTPPNLKGILTIGGPGWVAPNVTLDNISFSGAAIPDANGANGAGIRYEGGNLILNNAYFHANQEGLLADSDPSGTITINHSEFENNGNAVPPSSGIEHNLYVGTIQQLTIDNSYFYNPILGHDIKSRALNTTIEDSRIEDPRGIGSYEIDLPNGGNSIIKNNVIEKGADAQNSNFISFGEEGGLYPSSSLNVTGNTLINKDGVNAHLVVNATTIAASVNRNTAYGLTSGQLISGQVSSPENNTLKAISSAPALNTSAAYLPVIPFSFACFAVGTHILTADGPMPVEALHIGQQIVVVGSGRGTGRSQEAALRPIRWIGHRYIDLTRHADRSFAQPIRIRANAFAPSVPCRDLLISPDHAINVDGLLIPARLLQNGASIVREDRLPTVRYFHVELDQHDILLAEGLPTESYLDTGNRGVFENADAPLVLHPDLAVAASRAGIGANEQAQREALSCVPFAADAERVEPVWRRLAIRATQLGFVVANPAKTTDPLLRLLIDKTEHWPITIKDCQHVFVLPRSSSPVRLLSRSTAPCDIAPWVEDRRRLGVSIGRIALANPAGLVELPVDHPSLTEGWWAAERAGQKLWRWTNGNAVLPACSGATKVRIDLAGKNTYLQAQQVDQTAPMLGLR